MKDFSRSESSIFFLFFLPGKVRREMGGKVRMVSGLISSSEWLEEEESSRVYFPGILRGKKLREFERNIFFLGG